MQVTVLPPSPQLTPFVRSFTILETRDETSRVLLPDTGVLLGVRYSGSAHQTDAGASVRLPDATITGLRGTTRTLRTSARGGIVLATFREGGASALFAEPLHELFGQSIAMDAIVPHTDVERVRARIAEAPDHRERLRLIEEFLLCRIKRTPDPIVSAAVRAIRAARGTVHVGDLARELGISRNRLEKRFRRAVGTSPKQLASMHRLLRAVDLVRGGSSLTRASVDAGYFDQSHFIREFRSCTGEAPRRFFESKAHC